MNILLVVIRNHLTSVYHISDMAKETAKYSFDFDENDPD